MKSLDKITLDYQGIESKNVTVWIVIFIIIISFLLSINIVLYVERNELLKEMNHKSKYCNELILKRYKGIGKYKNDWELNISEFNPYIIDRAFDKENHIYTIKIVIVEETMKSNF